MPAADIASMYDCFLPSLVVCCSLPGPVCAFGVGWGVEAGVGFAACVVRAFGVVVSGLTTITLLSCSCLGDAPAPSAACAIPRNALPASNAPTRHTKLPDSPATRILPA